MLRMMSGKLDKHKRHNNVQQHLVPVQNITSNPFASHTLLTNNAFSLTPSPYLSFVDAEVRHGSDRSRAKSPGAVRQPLAAECTV
ncbi:hypothetical protein CEXT_721461 [Caerostris extrusa]|uniref:Uncharacterized protein n=1 Tax=Caerostris extrusa TaxID=172846 RepID=A0AAV4WX15_CAEEX|nr:hypothetical protein CEXT_721461 [Caerostris extrusa]